MDAERNQLLVIVGPTASGKTAVGLELCELLGGEIVSADSLLVYRGLDIGTAKPTRDEQNRARHHLINIVAPDEEYSAAQWARDAATAIEEIFARGQQPIILGGTGFYINALLRPRLLASAPPNPALRGELEHFAAREGREALHARLQSLDSAAAQRLHLNDVARIVRAIEVALWTCDTPSAPEPASSAPYDYAAFGLEMSRETLYARINARVEMMLAAGFLDELSTLLAAGYADSAPLQSLGYKQMRGCLENSSSCEEGVELWKRETRRYAKRQMTWFRRQLDVAWIQTESTPGVLRSPRDVAAEIAARHRKATSENDT